MNQNSAQKPDRVSWMSKPLVWAVAAIAIASGLMLLRNKLDPNKKTPTAEIQKETKVQKQPKEPAPKEPAPKEPPSRDPMPAKTPSPAKPLKEQPETNPANKIEQLNEAIGIALDNSDDASAYKMARELTRLAPDEPGTKFLMARVLGRRKRFPEAVQMLDQLIVGHPETKLAVYGQTSDWLVRFGRFDEAERRLQFLLSKAPDAAIVHRSLADLLVRQGKRNRVTNHSRKLCEMGAAEKRDLIFLLRRNRPLQGTANEVEPIGPMGDASNLSGQNNWQSIRTLLENVDECPPAGQATLGRALAELGATEELAKWADREANTKTMQFANAWYAMGVLSAKKSSHVQAVKQFCECVLRDPTHRSAYEGLSESLTELKNFTEQAKLSRKRADLLEQTFAIGEKLSGEDAVQQTDISTLVEKLQLLDRNLEAVNWEFLLLRFAELGNTMTNDQLDREYLKLESKLKNAKEPSKESILCGVDLNDEFFQ